MRTVTFRFKKTGFNAHTASGRFTYDTAENAKVVAESMRKQPGFFAVKLVRA